MSKLRPLPQDDLRNRDIQYHYSRQERLSEASAFLKGSLAPEQRNWFSRNRGLLLILGNILLIILIASIFIPLASVPDGLRLGGLSFQGTWFSLEGEYFLRVRAETQGAEPLESGGDDSATLNWTLRFEAPPGERENLEVRVFWAGSEGRLLLEAD